MSDTSLIFNMLTGRNTVSPETKKIANDVRFMAVAMKAASITATAATAAIGVGFVSLAAHAVALTAAVAPAVGALALLPAGLVSAGAGFAALKIATSGLGEAMKATASGGTSAGAAIAAAEKRVAQAQREATAAQDAINDARLTAAERLEDLSRSLARARLDEEGAVLAVADAERNLRQARRGGDRNERARADLAYRESVQTLSEVRDRLADMSQEEAEASAAGVEGSTEVRGALQRQADAVEALREAQAALKQASTGGGGVDKAAEAYAKLSPAGKQLVDVLKQLAPQWQAVQRAVQQATFANVGRDIQVLAGTWLPILKVRLSGIGGAWNTAIRQSLGLATSAGFVADMNAALGNAVTFSDRLGRSFAPFLNAFRQFAVVGSTFLPDIGQWVLTLAQRFERWAAAARESGRMREWIADAGVVLKDLGAIALSVGGIIAGVFSAGTAGPGYLGGLRDGAAALRDFVQSAEGQEKLTAFFTALRDVGSALWQVLVNLGPAVVDLGASLGGITDIISVSGVVFGFLADHLDELAVLLPYIIAAFVAFKAVQVAYFAYQVAVLPITVAQTIANWRLGSAMRANTAALTANAVATRTVASAQAVSNVAMTAGGTATHVAAGGTRALGFAMKALPIIGWIALIVDLVMWIVALWNTNEGFRTFVIGVWEAIWGFLKMIGNWFATDFVGFFVGAYEWIKMKAMEFNAFVINTFLGIVGFVTSLPGRITAAASGMWDGLVNLLRGAINAMIGLWNRLDLGLHIRIPEPIAGLVGFSTLTIPDLFPDFPYLYKGGVFATGGAAVVGDRGPELVNLPRGAQVTPLPSGGGFGDTRMVVDVRGGDADLRRLLRKWIRVYGAEFGR